jgi:uncharacterized protein YndB with AHSA1/START domain
MKVLNCEITIKANAQKVWQMLWDELTYCKWTSAFCVGAHIKSNWIVGERVHFLDANNDGMYSNLLAWNVGELVVFEHIGDIINANEMPIDDATMLWTGANERYSLTSVDKDTTTLHVAMDLLDEYYDSYMVKIPNGLAILRELAENPCMLDIEIITDSTIDRIWNAWNDPKHIVGWAFASTDWCCPYASNDLKIGGNFTTRMEAKDKSFGFDIHGTYKDVVLHKTIVYEMEDGRMVQITFETVGDKVRLLQRFEAETENSLTLQQSGWQAILNNFKDYVMRYD